MAVFCVISRPPEVFGSRLIVGSSQTREQSSGAGSRPRLLLLHLGSVFYRIINRRGLSCTLTPQERVAYMQAWSRRQVSTPAFNLPRADKYITVVRVMYAAVRNDRPGLISVSRRSVSSGDLSRAEVS